MKTGERRLHEVKIVKKDWQEEFPWKWEDDLYDYYLQVRKDPESIMFFVIRSPKEIGVRNNRYIKLDIPLEFVSEIFELIKNSDFHTKNKEGNLIPNNVLLSIGKLLIEKLKLRRRKHDHSVQPNQ